MKNILLIVGMLLTTQVFSQQIEKYWTYEIDPETIYYEKIDTTKNITIARGLFIDSLKHGEWVMYWGNGKIQTVINFKKGLRHGIWKSYDQKGRLVLRKKYRNNHLISSEERRYY